MTPLPVQYTDDIFDRMANRDNLELLIRQHHTHFLFGFGYEPIIHLNRFDLVAQAYARDGSGVRVTGTGASPAVVPICIVI